jgi:hypothetical protein
MAPMFIGSKRLLYVGIVLGWLLGIATVQLAGFSYTVVDANLVQTFPGLREHLWVKLVNESGWEVESRQSDYVYLRRSKLVGWVEGLRCNERWCL